ncbi:MAG: hypothetical protein P4M02_01365 [Clostridia bacterium]|nr:hypothetical protein [Clostridia bacterium]
MISAKTDLTVDELLATAVPFDAEAYFAAIRLRHDRPWVFDLIKVLWGRQRGLEMPQLYREIREYRGPTGLINSVQRFEAAVRSALNHHTSQSSRWKGKPEDDLFYSPRGRGTWAVRPDKALAWLKSHDLPNP